MTVCAQSGCPTLVERGYCAQHQRAHPRRGVPSLPARAPGRYDWAWRRLVATAIAAQPWCTMCYATEDLTADHIVPLVRGGQSVSENVQVLCRSCNSRKGGR